MKKNFSISASVSWLATMALLTCLSFDAEATFYDRYEVDYLWNDWLYDSASGTHSYVFNEEEKTAVIIDSAVAGPIADTWLSSNFSNMEALIIPEYVYRDGEKYTVVGIDEDSAYNLLCTSLTIAPSVRFIEQRCFNDFYNPVTSLDLGKVERIGDKCFVKISGLETLRLPDELFSIGNDSFRDCGFKNIIFGEYLRKIGKQAFCNSPELEAVEFPKYMNYLDDGSFCNCPKLTRVVIPERVASRGLWECFNSCPEITEIVICLKTYKDMKFKNCFDAVDKTKCVVKVPEGMKELYDKDPIWEGFTIVEDPAIAQVENIAEDNKQAPVYYYLDGMKASGSDLPTGQILIERQGNSSRKIIRH